MFDRIFLVVTDSVGIGGAPDAAKFGDEGAHTLRSVMSMSPALPNLSHAGLFNIECAGLSAHSHPSPYGVYGGLEEISNGKDTTVGHWEIAGIISENAMPTYPDGFPDDVINAFCEAVGSDILCNAPYSGTVVINEFGDEHCRTGKPIVYTSADSVFQIACHEDIIPIEKLYEMCEKARKILTGRHGVGRVIARPFQGSSGSYYRTTRRKDFSLTPPSETLLDKLKKNGFDVISIGKIYDIFAGRGITEPIKTKTNEECENALLEVADRDFKGLCFVNLVEFDSVYGHRNDTPGYARALEHFDTTVGTFAKKMREGDLLIITADHGCDPGFKGTDHSRERVPLVVIGGKKGSTHLGVIKGFTAVAKTVCEIFDIENDYYGTSFLDALI